MEVAGTLPPHLRTYQLMKAFPGLSPQAIDEAPALQLDWLLAIDTEVKRGSTP